MTRRKYTETMLLEAVQNSSSYVDVLRYLGIGPIGMQTHISNQIRKFGIDTSHFKPPKQNRGPGVPPKLTAKDILKRQPEGSLRRLVDLLRRALSEMGVETKCNRCGLGPVWNGKFLRLEVNHIDGDVLNCLFENLEFICPNCHSQETDTNKPHKNRIKNG